MTCLSEDNNKPIMCRQEGKTNRQNVGLALRSFYSRLVEGRDIRQVRLFRSDVYLALAGLLVNNFVVLRADQQPPKEVVDIVRNMSYNEFYEILVDEGLIPEDKI